MRIAALLLFVGAIMGIMVSQAVGQGTEPTPTNPATLCGTVVKVDGANVVVKAGGNEVTVVTDDKTVVTLDGKEAKVADLKADMHVVVTPAEGTATEIKAKSPKVNRDAPPAPPTP
jgi:hypothetical protein